MSMYTYNIQISAVNAITNHTVHTHLSKQDFRMLCRTFAHQVSCQPLETKCYLANIWVSLK